MIVDLYPSFFPSQPDETMTYCMHEVPVRPLAAFVWALLLMSLFVASAPTSYAQSANDQNDEDTTLRRGVWALQFQINQNFTLGAFEHFVENPGSPAAKAGGA